MMSLETMTQEEVTAATATATAVTVTAAVAMTVAIAWSALLRDFRSNHDFTLPVCMRSHGP